MFFPLDDTMGRRWAMGSLRVWPGSLFSPLQFVCMSFHVPNPDLPVLDPWSKDVNYNSLVLKNKGHSRRSFLKDALD